MLFLSLSWKFHRGAELCTKCLKLLEELNRKWGQHGLYIAAQVHYAVIKKEDNTKDTKRSSLIQNEGDVKTSIYILYYIMRNWELGKLIPDQTFFL